MELGSPEFLIFIGGALGLLNVTYAEIMELIFWIFKPSYIHVPLPIEACSPDELAAPPVAAGAAAVFIEFGARIEYRFFFQNYEFSQFILWF